ncbi:TRAP transporter large permease [Oceanibacterium hippocampi]|uniref:TRAP transporter large permease protein n=1 Tax=Oceanibacterium hippocampi TaxID=745714 RepID=A0A1Y5TWF7_9PROT|nr:TRAP transporter large permease [Oceanibacterium hippocampi]SLN75342.1 Sialic acid TRAP transporter permease protein SiaT [Oceanibacterium hippocampi]
MVVVLIVVLFGLLALGLPVAVALTALALTLDHFYSFFPLLPALGEMLWGGSTNFALIAVPLFILTGELLLGSGIAHDMYDAIDRWVRRVPGGLLHTNIASSALFSATSGSSVASAATIGTVAIPQMKAGGYHPPLFLGSIAAGGTLGILIPPSINMIIYGVLAEVSIGRLYLAGLIPGLLLAALFSLMVLVLCALRPGLGGNREIPTSWRERIAGLPALLPPLMLFILMVGSIYLGIATPTEAAGLGFLGAVILTAMRRRLTVALLMHAFERTMKTTCMVMLIVIAALLVNFVMVSIGLSGQIRDFVGSLALQPIVVMLILIATYLVLGCFMETLSLMIATTPIVVPIIVALGYDPLWFGVLFMVLIEAALITPPIGVNLFVVQSVRSEGPFRDVTIGSLPFLLMMLCLIGLLLAFPELASWLPAAVRG